MGHRQPADRPERTSHHRMHLCRDAIAPGRLGGRLWRRQGDAAQCRSHRARRWIHHHGDVPTGGVTEHASQPREGAGRDGAEDAARLRETVQHRLHLGQSGASVKADGGLERKYCCWKYSTYLIIYKHAPEMAKLI